MRVEVAYRGRIEAFDTDRFTEAQPFSGKSMLADLTLDYADVEKKGLWLTAHCYAANEDRQRRGPRGEAREGLEVPARHPERGRRNRERHPGRLDGAREALRRARGRRQGRSRLRPLRWARRVARQPHREAERLPGERRREAGGKPGAHGGGGRRHSAYTRKGGRGRSGTGGASRRHGRRLDGRIRK